MHVLGLSLHGSQTRAGAVSALPPPSDPSGAVSASTRGAGAVSASVGVRVQHVDTVLVMGTKQVRAQADIVTGGAGALEVDAVSASASAPASGSHGGVASGVGASAVFAFASARGLRSQGRGVGLVYGFGFRNSDQHCAKWSGIFFEGRFPNPHRDQKPKRSRVRSMSFCRPSER